jgi:hypothetical protein
MRTLLLILVLCGGAGAWNYHRNLQAERAEPRPYRSLTEEALASLAAALEAEVEDLTSSYEAASGRKVSITEEALLGEKVREVERVQSISQSTRAIGQRLSQSEGSLQRVRKELRRREEESDLLRLHLRRLISF